MIQELNVIKYRKLQNKVFKLNKDINIISGTNGTCKTSLLYLISNSMQEVTRTCTWLKNPQCLGVINNIIDVTNPKIESLTKGDKKYNNPAPGVKGALYSVKYDDGKELFFRKHNSLTIKGDNRFSIKPKYARSKGESLPRIPVIYLGLSRLFAFGEFNDDESIVSINKKLLPEEYQKIISEEYESFTHIKINFENQQRMGSIKTRSEFESSVNGVDSNTISAGEDNLLIIITALVALKYYYDSIISNRETESILLVDELDATLHPAFQIKLLKLFKKYSDNYKIQFIFTTHSMSLIEYAMNQKFNLLYLIDNVSSVSIMKDPDIYKIKMHLNNSSRDDIYLSKMIPVFTEDDEARLFINCIFDYFYSKYSEFQIVRQCFHFVKSNISGDVLNSMFSDGYLLRSTMRSICILDGDKNSYGDYEKHIILLPGKASVENIVFKFAEELFLGDYDDFWLDNTVMEYCLEKHIIKSTSEIK